MAPVRSRHFEIERVAPGVHVARPKASGFALCNAGIVDLGGTTVVFDSMLTPMAGRALARAAERLTGRPPDFVVNSHYHGDHTWGNASFPSAHIVATRRTRELVRERSADIFRDWVREFRRELPRLGRESPPMAPRDLAELRGWYRGVLATPRPLRVVAPDVTFAEEIVLEGARRALRVISYGGGHTDSDAFALLPDERVVFAGDLALNGYHLSMGDGWPSAWSEILRRIERLRPATVVPGHGPVGSGRLIRTSAEYLRAIDGVARAARRDRLTPKEVEGLPVPSRFRALGFPWMFPANVARARRLLAPRSRTPRREGSFK